MDFIVSEFINLLIRREGGKPFYPLDNILGLSPYQQYSPLLPFWTIITTCFGAPS